MTRCYLVRSGVITNAHLLGACLSTMLLFRRRSHAPLSQTCTAGACACSCKSRRAPRPRKPDGKLSRHGLGARRVALLAPRGVLSKYRHPLGYVGAITKIFSKVQKSVPHFGRRELYSEWGRSPGGEEGVSYSHVRGRQPISNTGEESPNGAPRKMHAFCGVPGLEGEIKITPKTDSPGR